MSYLRLLLQDQRGEADTTGWLMLQVPLWFLIAFIFVVVVVGVKQIGTTAQAHAAARTASTATLAAGQSSALLHGQTWGVPGAAAQLQSVPDQRSVAVRWAYTWHTGVTLVDRIVGGFRVDVSDMERREGFYAGPPGAWE